MPLIAMLYVKVTIQTDIQVINYYVSITQDNISRDVRAKGVSDCRSSGMELSPRTPLGSQHRIRTFQGGTENTLVPYFLQSVAR